jgi:thioredoxin-like negative regulator of GroEL
MGLSGDVWEHLGFMRDRVLCVGRCGPCQVMVPILNHVGHALKEKIRVVKIDTEKYPSIASRFSVQALPTFVLFQNGKSVMRLEGVVQAQELIGQIEQALYLLQSKA